MKKDRTEKVQAPETPEITRCVIDLKESTIELKELETVLKETEAKYRNIFENAMEGIFQTDREGRFTQANPSFARMHGYASPDEIMHSISARELFVDPSDHDKLIEILRKSGSVQNYEAQLRIKNGKTHWVSMNAMVFRDENGKTLSYEGTMLDITERKKTEEALSESEERYRVAIENSNDGITMLHGDICQYANKQFVKMFEYDSIDEVIGKSIKPTVHPDDVEMVTDIMNRRQRGEPVPSRYEFKGITKKGNIIYVGVSAASITYRSTSVYLIYLRDITERKLAEEALVKSHKELERLNKAKTKAVNHISHELKTPLAVIQGNIRLLKRKFENIALPLKASLKPWREIRNVFLKYHGKLMRYSGYRRKSRQEWPLTILIVCWKGWKISRKYRKQYARTGKPSKNGQASTLAAAPLVSVHRPLLIRHFRCGKNETDCRASKPAVQSRGSERPFYFYGPLYSQRSR